MVETQTERSGSAPVARCRSCAGPLQVILDLGNMPLCSRLLEQPSEQPASHELALGQCQSCGLLQLRSAVSPVELRPKKPIRYTEPESHLDQVAEMIRRLPEVTLDSPICGVSFKDRSLVDRLRASGMARAVCFQSADEWQIANAFAGVETLQEVIATIGPPEEQRGRYQVVIARHILEHAHDLHGFVQGLASLLSPAGYLVFEVPDFTTSLTCGDYSTLWEEHVFYFTSGTFEAALNSCGVAIRRIDRYPHFPEESLVAITQKAEAEPSPRGTVSGIKASVDDSALLAGRKYGQSLDEVRETWVRELKAVRDAGQSVALLGAGHLGIMFLNALELAPVIDVVVDEDPDKRGLYLPGAGHIIREMAALDGLKPGVCLLTVSPEGESRVMARHKAYLARGWRFASIFPGSGQSFLDSSNSRS